MDKIFKKRIDFSSPEMISVSSALSKKREEISIYDLERALKIFREKGSESELLAFIREITSNNRHIPKEKGRKVNIYTENVLQELNIFLKNKFRVFISSLGKIRRYSLKNKYTKGILKFLSIFFVIYLILNFPIYYKRLNWFLAKTEKKVVKVSELEQIPMAKSAPLDPGETITKDSRLLIPKLKIDAPIIFLDSRKEEDVQAGLQRGVVRFGGMSNPGEAGNTYLIGHSSNYWWDKGKYNYVFVLLDKMEIGDRAKIYYNGNKYLYEVFEKDIVDPKDTSSLNQTNEPILTLMTCYPPGATSKRLIVKLKQVSPQYFAPRIVEKEKIIESPKNLPTTDSNPFWGIFKKIF